MRTLDGLGWHWTELGAVLTVQIDGHDYSVLVPANRLRRELNPKAQSVGALLRTTGTGSLKSQQQALMKCANLTHECRRAVRQALAAHAQGEPMRQLLALYASGDPASQARAVDVLTEIIDGARSGDVRAQRALDAAA